MDDDASRRREKRHNVALPVKILAGRREISGTTKDVSYNGMFIGADDLPDARAFVRLQVELQGGEEEIELSGMVVRHIEREGGGGGVGIKLYGNGDDVLKAWNEFIATAASQDAASHGDGSDSRVAMEIRGEKTIEVVVPLAFASPMDLLRTYLMDIPKGCFFVPTANNLAIGDVVAVHFCGAVSVFELKGSVRKQHRTPGDFGVTIEFIELGRDTLFGFWDFICDQGAGSEESAN